jgi:tRNA pseudouridine55 synthase
MARKRLGVKAIGHAGTLDPFASGLLVMLVGEATRLQDFVMHQDKTYGGRVLFGSETDSGDPTGQVTETLAKNHWPVYDQSTLEKIIAAQFTGKITQVPPAFSAIKIDGQRAYQLARKGEAVAMPSREVTLHRWAITTWDETGFDFIMDCSSGTYVRAAARDLGRALGLPCHLGALRRTAIGKIQVDGSPLPDQISREHLEKPYSFLELTAGIDLVESAKPLLAQGRRELLPESFKGVGFHPVRLAGEVMQIYQGGPSGPKLVFNLLSSQVPGPKTSSPKPGAGETKQ